MTSTLEVCKQLLREILAAKSITSDMRNRIQAVLQRGKGRPSIDADQVRKLREQGKSVAEIAESMGVGKTAVYQVVRGNRQ